ncbi:Leucine Rich repeats (2 copies) [Gimesia maris]|uniref:hypothetical protein n=1 Tax=Gimesia maris TaxID=122 RepID=UPI00118A5E30|nr:hypothetical protein [Gimesia maris]QDU14195.1 Leucine Rich repeats (2 copies) [Gimesia maris]
MIVISLKIHNHQHILNHTKIISKLMELFPGTKVIRENTYNIKRDSIQKVASKYAAEGRVFSIQKRMEDEVNALEDLYGPSKQVSIPINNGNGFFEGYICVSGIQLSSESLVEISSAKLLLDYLKSLNVGEIDVSDYKDKKNSKRLKQILGKQIPVSYGAIELDDIPMSKEQKKALDLILSQKIQVGAFMRHGKIKLSIVLSKQDDTDQICKHIREVGLFTNLNFHHSNLTGKGLQHLSGMPKLKVLHIKDTSVSGHAFSHLTSFPQLEELYATPTLFGNEAMFHIGKLTRLKKLDIASATINDAGIQELENLRDLVSLNLANIPLSKGLHVVSNFEQLESLDLSGSTSVNGDMLAIITQLPHLKCLCLGPGFVTNEDIIHLTKSKTINTLTLAGKKITTAGIKQNLTSVIFPELAKMSNLKHLQISDIPLNEAGINSLSTIRTLQYLSIKDSLATDSHRQLLANKMANCNITWFDSSEKK